MRASTLLAFCTAALFSSGYAAPLSMYTVINAPPVLPTFTLQAKGPGEVPNLPVPTALPGSNSGTSKDDASVQRRNVAFRQADYGVNPVVAWDAIAPMQEQATPRGTSAVMLDAVDPAKKVAATHTTTAAHARRTLGPPADEPAPVANAAAPATAANPAADAAVPSPGVHAATPPPPPLPKPEPLPEADKAPAPASSAAAGAKSAAQNAENQEKPALSALDATNPSLPFTPDFSDAFDSTGSGFKALGTSRYQASDAVHSLLGSAFGTSSKASKSAASSSGPVPVSGGGLLRRFVRDARIITSPMRRFIKDVDYSAAAAPFRPLARRALEHLERLTSSAPAQYARRALTSLPPPASLVARHDLELNTDALLPSNTTSAAAAAEQSQKDAGLPETYVAEEAARKKRVALVNLDSNRPGVAPPPQADLPKPPQPVPQALSKASGTPSADPGAAAAEATAAAAEVAPTEEDAAMDEEYAQEEHAWGRW